MHARLVIATMGGLVAVLGLCMALVLPWSLLHNGTHGVQFLVLALTALIVGGGLFWFCRQPGAEYGLRDAFLTVTAGWVVAGFLGALPYYLSGTFPTFVDAVFESVSGFTTTGASVMIDIEQASKPILFWRSLTHWLGGMGIIVLSVAILPLLGIGGMAMFKAEVPSPVMDKLKPTVAATAKTLWKVYFVITIIETALLYVAGMSLFDALCHTFGTLATGGFSTKNLSIAYYENPLIHVIIIFFMLYAGVNFTLHYQSVTRGPRVYLGSLEFRLYMLLFAGSTIFIAWNVHADYSSMGKAFMDSAFQTASIMTTTGYVTADWEQWAWSCQWLLLSLMFMGGCAGSTGGGMKCLRLIIVAKHVLRELKLLIHPRAVIALRIDGKAVHTPIIDSIMAFIALFVGLWSLSTLLLVIMGVDMITAVGATTATLANVGPGLNAVGAVDNYAWLPSAAKWLLIFDMLAGRLELYAVFVLMVPDFWRK